MDASPCDGFLAVLDVGGGNGGDGTAVGIEKAVLTLAFFNPAL